MSYFCLLSIELRFCSIHRTSFHFLFRRHKIHGIPANTFISTVFQLPANFFLVFSSRHKAQTELTDFLSCALKSRKARRLFVEMHGYSNVNDCERITVPIYILWLSVFSFLHTREIERGMKRRTEISYLIIMCSCATLGQLYFADVYYSIKAFRVDNDIWLARCWWWSLTELEFKNHINKQRAGLLCKNEFAARTRERQLRTKKNERTTYI